MRGWSFIARSRGKRDGTGRGKQGTQARADRLGHRRFPRLVVDKKTRPSNRSTRSGDDDAGKEVGVARADSFGGGGAVGGALDCTW